MSLVYCLHIHQSTGPEYDWEYQVNEIEQMNPKKVICFCMEEYEPIRVFGIFFNKIQQWLIKENKKVICIVPSKSTFEYDNVTFEDSVGYYFYSKIAYDKALVFLADHGLGQRSHLLSCYNTAGKWERGLMIDQLSRYDLLKNNFVSLYSNIYNHPESGEAFNWKYHDGSWLKLEKDFRLHVPGTPYTPWDIPSTILQSFMDIVTESTNQKDNFFMTEKTVKSISCLKPFLALSCANYHKYLNEKFQFKYYDMLFDYSFDQYEKVEDRIEGIIQNVLRLRRRLEVEDKSSLLEEILPVLYYNREQYIKNFNNSELMIPKCLENNLVRPDDVFYYCNKNFRASIPLLEHLIKMNWLNKNRYMYVF